MQNINLKIAKVIFYFTLVFSFFFTELFYSSNFSPDFQTYYSFIDFNFQNVETTNHGHGHLYYYIISFVIYLKSNLISELNIGSILNSSIQLSNFLLFCFGLKGVFLLLKRHNIAEFTSYISMSVISFFPASIIMRVWMKPEILAFALLPWIIVYSDNYFRDRKPKDLIFTIVPLCLVLQTKGSIFGMVSLFLFFKYIKKIIENKEIIYKVSIIFIFFFGILYFENYNLNNIHLFDHRASDPENYNFKASFSFLTHINRLDFYYFPVFEYHNNSFIGITLLDTFGDYFNLSFNSDKAFFNYDALQITTNKFMKLYSREYVGLALSLILYMLLGLGAFKNKRFRIFYIAPFIGMFILILNAYGIPSNNFDPSKGDTLKVHYYSFLLTISFIFIFARTVNNKRLVSFISLSLLTSCFIFIMGFPKIESSNINFYLNDKNTFTNLCPLGKVVVGSDKNCNRPVSICDHNLYAESISFEIITEKKVRTISENHILKMQDRNNNIISVNNPNDCIKNLEDGVLLYNPIGKNLKIPPLINVLYLFISLISGIFLKRIKTI